MPVEARGPDQWKAAFAAIAGQRADGVITLQDANNYLYPQRLADLAARSRLPAVYPYHVNSNAGGLMSYGVNVPDMFRQSANFIDRILKGAKPGDIPVEQPTHFELVVNRKTAAALGITIPQSILLQATGMSIDIPGPALQSARTPPHVTTPHRFAVSTAVNSAGPPCDRCGAGAVVGSSTGRRPCKT